MPEKTQDALRSSADKMVKFLFFILCILSLIRKIITHMINLYNAKYRKYLFQRPENRRKPHLFS